MVARVIWMASQGIMTCRRAGGQYKAVDGRRLTKAEKKHSKKLKKVKGWYRGQRFLSYCSKNPNSPEGVIFNQTLQTIGDMKV